MLYLAVAVLGMAIAGAGQAGNALQYAKRLEGFGPGLDTVRTLCLLAASFAFLPLFGGRAALLCLVPAPLLLVGFPFTRQLLYYYSFPLLPFLAFAAGRGAGRLARRVPRVPGGAGMWVAGLAAAAGLAPLLLPTRTDGFRRLPFEVTARDRYRLDILRDLPPPDGRPAAIQFGLWGVVPDRPGMRALGAKNPPPDAYVVLDLKSPRDMARDEYIGLARQVMDDATAGRRRLLHERDGLVVASPADAPTTPPAGAAR